MVVVDVVKTVTCYPYYKRYQKSYDDIDGMIVTLVRKTFSSIIIKFDQQFEEMKQSQFSVI